jgi:putative membrane protein
MKLIARIFSLLVFILFFGFALKNTQEVALRFFLDYELRGPLVLLLLGFFFIGAVLGVLAMTPMLFRYRSEINRHQNQLDALQRENAEQRQASTRAPRPDGILMK